MVPWILISIVILLLILGVIVFLVTKKKKHKPDYYALFIMGLIWLPLGIPLDNYAFTVMGLLFMIIGLANKDKWKTNRRDWKTMDKNERKLMTIAIIVLGLLALAGLTVFYLAQKGILNI
ncbi:MAG: hypothetical protein ABIJ08_01080 [Nanoarchaeota archaeon]